MSYKTKKIKYEELEQEKLNFLIPILYEIDWDGVKYEILVNCKRRSKKAVIFGTGAILKDKPLPVFSRASWMRHMSYNGIWYFDPTVYLGDLVLGWGYGTNDRWYLQDIAKLVEIFLRKMKVSNDNTLFFGSSGGGFTSILLASMFRSRATAINPQLDVTQYFAGSVEQLQQDVLKDGESLIPMRTNASVFIRENGYLPVVHLVDNLFSSHDTKTQLQLFLNQLAADKVNCTDRLFVDFYSAKGGHGGMPTKEACLRIIEDDLVRPIPATNQFRLESKPMPVELDLQVALAGDQLKVTANATPVNEFTEYAYYLCKNSGAQAVVKQGYIKDSEFVFKLEEPGRYFVRVFSKNKYYPEDEYTISDKYTEFIEFLER